MTHISQIDIEKAIERLDAWKAEGLRKGKHLNSISKEFEIKGETYRGVIYDPENIELFTETFSTDLDTMLRKIGDLLYVETSSPMASRPPHKYRIPKGALICFNEEGRFNFVYGHHQHTQKVEDVKPLEK